jgi:biopolymer transport protein ExbD
MNAASPDTDPDPFDDDDEPVLGRRQSHLEAHFDITAMIDLVFMLNIFFLVTTVAAAQAEMELPIVRHCLATDPAEAVIISLSAINPQSVTVYLDDSAKGGGLIDHEDQTREVRLAVEDGSRSGKRIILIKAERSVKLKDVKRIAAAATKNITGMELRMAVIERE